MNVTYGSSLTGSLVRGWIHTFLHLTSHWVDIIYSASTLCGLYDGSGSSRDFVAKTFAFAVYDTQYEDVAANTILLGGFNGNVVRVCCLWSISKMIKLSILYSLIAWARSCAKS
jgi:hypothetical protein